MMNDMMSEMMSEMMKETKHVLAWGAPSRYYQGAGLLDELPQYTAPFGSKVLAVIDPFLFESISARLDKAYLDTDAELKSVPFVKEVTYERIRKMAEENTAFGASVVVGIGGGKTLDTAKGVADIGKTACIIVPSSASTDAPITAHSMMYTEDGDPLEPGHHDRNPDVILVDSKLIADAPPRLLAAGIGDALATAFEARARVRRDKANLIDAKTGGGYFATRLGIVAGEACLSILLEDGIKAMAASERHVVTKAFENVLEANILLSGMGVIDVGCAGAHAFAETLSGLPAVDKKSMHGEKVGFGLLCQLTLENESRACFLEMMDFCASIGLPITLDDLWIENTPENIRILAEYGSKYQYLWDAEPFQVTMDDIEAAITVTDELGTRYRRAQGTPPAYARR